VAAVARDDRVRDLLGFDAWDWVGELVGLTLLALVIVEILPVWVLLIAAVLTLRPFVRFAFRLAARILLDG
jgi:hypothetical protein